MNSHIHGLPYELRRSDFINGFANYAGEVRKFPSNKRDVMYKGEYMKNRISLDTNKPILPGLFLWRIGRKPIWVSMKYERLPNVCYKCGKLNHETRVCKENNLNTEQMFGRWL